MQNTILYFSIWESHRKTFSNLAERYNKDIGFQEIGRNISFSQASDLLTYLNGNQDDLKDLYVIVDYLPFFVHGCNYEESADHIRKAILSYPEVFFLFDESIVSRSEKELQDKSFTTFLFTNTSQYHILDVSYHKFDSKDKNPFVALRNRRSNLFDGSNLRFCVKKCYYKEINAFENFRRIQESRSQHLAICVEEEVAQNRFNSYALYVNGFRVRTVMSAQELIDINTNYNPSTRPIDLIVRDFDIQFADANPEKKELSEVAKSIEEQYKSRESQYKIHINLVDCIRGAKYCEELNKWINIETYNNNDFWNKLKDVHRFFISKGADHLEIKTDTIEYEKVWSGDSKSLFVDSIEKQFLRGMYKPITGIYHPFHNYSMIKKRFYNSVDWSKKQKNESEYYINTNRKEHQHGVPLDIYDLVKEMIDRACLYQQKEKYVISAMVAQEVIEILNGFHESLMLKAYHIYAVSENAICMNLLGGNEQWLKMDTDFRIDKIKYDVERMLARKNETKDRRGLELNVLNQIFSDCREFCYNKEHFLSEDAFVSAMAHLNDGYDIGNIGEDIVNSGKSIIKFFINTIENIIKFFINTIENIIKFFINSKEYMKQLSKKFAEKKIKMNKQGEL